MITQLNTQGKESGFLGFDVPPLSECHDQPQVATARHRFSDSFDHEMQHLVVSLTDCRVTYPLKCMKVKPNHLICGNEIITWILGY